jgi:Coenzyme PQQ synthesis protein D (PqqD)
MRAADTQALPLARKDQLVIQELPGELLVYDLDRHKAYCLNKAAAAVWKHCDGKLAVADMTRLLEKELKTPVETEVVWLALQQLDKFHLLQERMTILNARPGISRRALMQRIGVAALLMPAIISVAVPTAVSAASCLPLGATCASGTDCCSNCCRFVSIGSNPVCVSPPCFD